MLAARVSIEFGEHLLTVHGKEIPTELHELVAPNSTAFLIIDMQNDMCAVGGITDKAGKDLSMYVAMIPRIAAFADECRNRDVPVLHVGIYTLPNGESDSAAWIRLRMRARSAAASQSDQPWQPWNCTLIGTWGADFVDELQPRPGEIVIAKYRSSAFYNTNLDLVLRANRIRTVIVAGCTTEGCVEATVRDLGFHDYFSVVASDLVGSDVPALHEASMFSMSSYRTDVADANDIITAWRSLNPVGTA